MHFNFDNLKISHKGLMIVFVPLLIGLIILTLLVGLLDRAEYVALKKEQYAAIQNDFSNLVQMDLEAVSYLTTFIFTKQDSYLERYQSITKEAAIRVDELCHSLAPWPDQVATIKRTQKAQRRLFALMDEFKAPRDLGEHMDFMGVIGVYDQMQALVRQNLHDISDMRQAQAKINEGAKLNPKDSRLVMRYVIWFGVFVSGAIAVLLSLFFTWSITRRIGIVVDNSLRLASQQPLNPRITGTDEIAHLDKTFHKMAAALDEAARRERAIIENASDVICSIDANNKFTQVSPASFAVWGYEPDELIGRRVVDIVIENDVEQTLSSLNQAAHSTSSLPLENHIKHKDGDEVTMLWSIHWSEAEKSHVCVVHDITVRKAQEDLLRESEARVRLIIESLPVALVIGNTDGQIEMTNMKTEQMFGYSQSDLIGHHISELLTGSAVQTVDSLYRDYVGRVKDVDIMRKDRSHIPVELTVSLFELKGTNKFLVVLLDVTERRKVEQMKKEFIQMVTHDLRSPLAGIMGSLEMFGMETYGPISDKGKVVLTRCDSNISRLLSLIDGLLDLEKLQAGKMQVDFEVIDLASVVARSVSAISYLAEKNDIQIKAPKESMEAFADGPKLVQVLVNLLSNAIKFSPPHSTITVSYEELDESIVVKVSDQGRGVPAEFKESIFDRFQQVEKEDQTDKGGKGLGLAICKAIVEGHGGAIGVDSEPGKGSSFWFSIRQPT